MLKMSSICSETLVLKKYGSYNSCSSKGTPHTNLQVMKGHLKMRLNTAAIPIVLSTPTHMEPSFISESVSFGSRTLSCKNPFSHNRLFHLLEPVLFYSLCWHSILTFVRKTQLNMLFFLPIWKSLINVKREHWEYLFFTVGLFFT
jgi:hypothetical protein